MGIKYRIIIVFIGLISIITSCTRHEGFYESVHANTVSNESILTYLEAQKGVYDSFLLAINLANIEDSLREGEYTVFAPTNGSFINAFDNLNNLRRQQGREPLHISNLPSDELDSMVAKYVLRGIVPTDSMMEQDGRDFESILFGFSMHARYVSQRAEGHVDGGPSTIEYSDMRRSNYIKDWSTSKTLTADIQTANGIVNLLDQNHVFGFGELNIRVNPTFSRPYLGHPLPLPGIVQSQFYDLGGQGVAYYNEDYFDDIGTSAVRPEDGLFFWEMWSDGGYALGSPKARTWLVYTVEVADTGSFKFIHRYASPYDGSSVIYWFGKDRIGKVDLPGTGDWGNYIYYGVNGEDVQYFPKKGTIAFKFETGPTFDVNYEYFKVVPYNKPWPVPGTILAEEFNPEEGVGYHDMDGNKGDAGYRTDEGVDLYYEHDIGGIYLKDVMASEWLEYDIEVKKTGQYEFSASVSNGGGSFRLEIDGIDVSGEINYDGSQGKRKWIDVPTIVQLEKGVHKMRFYIVSSADMYISSFKYKSL